MYARINEATGRVILAAVAAWALIVGGAALDDLFGKFDAKSVAIFTVGVALYAFATYRIDGEVRAFFQDFARAPIVIAACLALATLAAASFWHAHALAVFAAPLAAVASAAAVEKLTARATKARGKSRAATPAAT